MSRNHSKTNEKGALEMLEEAAQLLRQAPMSILSSYCVGTLPFVLGLLFFCTDMGTSGVARSRLLESSLAVSLLFLWMKCWQAVFASRLRGVLMGTPSAPWTVKRILGMIRIQVAVMSWEVLVLPVAMLLTLPFGWCCAFFHNLSVIGDGQTDTRTAFEQARRQASLWPAQNVVILLVLTPFSLFVLLNLCAALYLVPMVLNTFLGIETIFLLGRDFLFNTTFWVAILGLVYLCLNPLVKAVYVLRCYYGDSLHSGHDLLVALRRLRRGVARSAFLILAPVFLCALNPCGADLSALSPPSVSSEGETVSPERIDQAIAEEINSLEYDWRLPGSKMEDADEKDSNGFLSQALKGIRSWVGRAWRWTMRTLEKMIRWVYDHLPSVREKPSNEGAAFGRVELQLAILLVAVIGIAFFLLRRYRKGRASSQEPQDAPPLVSTVPDLKDEDTLPDQLPSAQWVDVARELRDRGDLRLALRAYFFAGMAHLAHGSLLTIRKSNSNRDYERELERRAHALPGIVSSFSESVAILERCWYGIHEVHEDVLDRFLILLQRITSHGRER